MSGWRWSSCSAGVRTIEADNGRALRGGWVQEGKGVMLLHDDWPGALLVLLHFNTVRSRSPFLPFFAGAVQLEIAGRRCEGAFPTTTSTNITVV